MRLSSSPRGALHKLLVWRNWSIQVPWLYCMSISSLLLLFETYLVNKRWIGAFKEYQNKWEGCVETPTDCNRWQTQKPIAGTLAGAT